MGKENGWSLTSGTGDATSSQKNELSKGVTIWDPLSGITETQSQPSKKGDLPEPTSFAGALKQELSGAATDSGMLIGREIRNEWVEAVHDMWSPKHEPHPPRTPSKLKKVAEVAGTAAVAGVYVASRAARWTIKTGINATREWLKNRSSRNKNNSQGNPIIGLLTEDNSVIKGEWSETPENKP